MYYWKTPNLALEIKEGNVTEESKKNYYLATGIIGTAFMYLAVIGGSEDTIATLTECILVITVTIIGINVTFTTNRGNEGVSYISRVVMLSLPLLVKIFLISIVAGFLLGAVAGVSGNSDLVPTQWGVTVISVLVQIFYFWRINVHLRFINT